MSDKSSVDDLLKELELKSTGKLILVNNKAVENKNYILSDKNEIKIFKLI